MSQKKPQILYKKEEEEPADSYDSNVNPFNENIQNQEQKEIPMKKTKKVKKNKKERKHHKQNKHKKSKKNKRNQDRDYSEEDQESRNSMFDDEAESGQQDEDDYEAQIGYEQERQRFEELYKRPNATQRLLQKFKGKNQRQINAQYSKKVYAIRNQGEAYPSEKDPKLFVVQVRKGSEDQLVVNIVNKAKYFLQNQKRVGIFSVIALKKRYPGILLVQAYTVSQVRDFLQGFVNVYHSKKIEELESERYTNLFAKPKIKKLDFKQNTFVRINKGLYEGDLAKIFKIKKNSIDVMLVPRINIAQIKNKIISQTQKISNQDVRKLKQEQLFKLFTDHKQNNYSIKPIKKQMFQSDFAQLHDMPGVKNIRLGSMNGLIILTYLPDQLSKVHGTYLPIQMMPFTADGKLIEQIKDDIGNYMTVTNFKKGEDVQIIAGALQKHYGTMIQIKGNVGVILCKSKQLKDQVLQQPLEHLTKRFKKGQRVKVTSGTQIGKVGIITKVQTKNVQIFTDNYCNINVSKRSLQLYHSQPICNQNVHSLSKNDLIKTVKNTIGIVLETTKDNIKILTTNNTIQIINNMDFDQKISIRHLTAINRSGQQIKTGAIISIKTGVNQGKKCNVLHVYLQNAFLFNSDITRNAGIICENIDNCSLLMRSDLGRPVYKAIVPSKVEGMDGEQITVGKIVKVRQGLYRGEKGVVKSLTKDRMEVRILPKCVTVWVSIQNQGPKAQPEQQQQKGKTPNRIQSSFRGFSRPYQSQKYQDM